MTDKILQLKKEVFSTQAPSRELIVRYFRAIVDEAKKLPVSERDDLAAEILQPFIELNQPPEEDNDLEYVVFQLVGGTLDVLHENAIAMSSPEGQVKDRKRKELVWQEVIDRIEQLHA